LFEKKRSYSKYVGDVHKPNASHLKSKELENLRDRLHHPVRQTVRISPGTSLPLLPPVSQNRSYQQQLLNGFNKQCIRSNTENKRHDTASVNERRTEPRENKLRVKPSQSMGNLSMIHKNNF